MEIARCARDFEVWREGEEVNQREIAGWELWFVILGERG